MGKTKKFTLRRVFEAMKDDPTPKTVDEYVDYNVDGDNAPRCAVGGAAFVLGVDPDALGEALVGDSLKGIEPDETTPFGWITKANDETRKKKATIGKEGLKRYANHLDKEIVVEVE